MSLLPVTPKCWAALVTAKEALLVDTRIANQWNPDAGSVTDHVRQKDGLLVGHRPRLNGSGHLARNHHPRTNFKPTELSPSVKLRQPPRRTSMCPRGMLVMWTR